MLEKISSLSSKLFSLEDQDRNVSLTSSDISSLALSRQLLSKVHSLLDFICRCQGTYLASLCKFSYLTQRVFLYIIYQGFCGKDDQEDQEQKQKDDQYLDNDGCGMGDGQGENNVSNEIENEEQLEGLKNYESEEE